MAAAGRTSHKSHTFIDRHLVRHFDLLRYSLMPEHLPAFEPAAAAG
jgi:hypothetical protein